MVDPASEITGDQTDIDTDQNHANGCTKANDQSRTSSPDQLTENIPAQKGGPQ